MYRDDKPPGRFCCSLCQAVDTLIVNSVQLAERTGRGLHEPAVTKEMYDHYGFPWFYLYDDDIAAVHSISASLFKRVMSIGDASIRENLSTGAGTCGICMDTQNNATLADCRHKLCSDCLYHMLHGADADPQFSTQKSDSNESGDRVKCPLCRKNTRDQDIQYSSAPLKLEDIGANNI